MKPTTRTAVQKQSAARKREDAEKRRKHAALKDAVVATAIEHGTLKITLRKNGSGPSCSYIGQCNSGRCPLHGHAAQIERRLLNAVEALNAFERGHG